MTNLVYAAEMLGLLYLLAGAVVGLGWLRRRTLTEPGGSTRLTAGPGGPPETKPAGDPGFPPGSLSVLVAGRRATRRGANDCWPSQPGALVTDSPQIYDWASGE